MKTAHFIKPDITTSQDLSLAAMSYTTTIGRKFKLEQILFHASVPITETITITLDSAKGANYDVVLRKKSLNAEQDFVFQPEGEINFQANDELKIQCTNANATGVLYVSIRTSEM